MAFETETRRVVYTHTHLLYVVSAYNGSNCLSSQLSLCSVYLDWPHFHTLEGAVMSHITSPKYIHTKLTHTHISLSVPAAQTACVHCSVSCKS